MTVEDDGIGFQAYQDGTGLKQNEGFGLFNIQERLEHFGGHFQVVSRPGHGTKVTLTMPWEKISINREGIKSKLKRMS